MVELEQLQLELSKENEPLQLLRESLHLNEASKRISELELHSSEPGFWDDIEHAQKIQQEITALKRKQNRFNTTAEILENLQVLCELGILEEDKSVQDEIEQGYELYKQQFEQLKMETLFKGEHDNFNAIMTLHPGAGGTEAQDWTQMLFRMYSRWAEQHDYSLDILDYLDGDEAGIKSVSFRISGENAYGYLKSEAGVHRLVRVSPFDSSGRRHTSFASVEVIPELDDSIEVNIDPDDLRIDYYRASGAGGQHVNKTSSAVRITHIPTGVVVSCQSERSQKQNRDTAMNMLKSKLFTLALQAQTERIEDLKGDQLEIGWGSQIRSYVFMPYTKVKDHRTEYEMGDVGAVMDGDLDGFINAYLIEQSKKQPME
ncbi:MAG: peptide chain release factor 2 [Clostridiaceae bacterium]|nr:peptide chain release factor 2 [Clostridiaceae bacterium]